jgi:hypothetical protein
MIVIEGRASSPLLCWACTLAVPVGKLLTQEAGHTGFCDATLVTATNRAGGTGTHNYFGSYERRASQTIRLPGRGDPPVSRSAYSREEIRRARRRRARPYSALDWPSAKELGPSAVQTLLQPCTGLFTGLTLVTTLLSQANSRA